MNQKITIFIPVRNGEQFIEKTICSVIMQTFTEWRLVIRDNCSTDQTKNIVQKFLSDPRIEWKERNHDIGLIGNYNSCLIDISTEYYMIFSHDDYFLSANALEKAYKILELNPDIPKVHCDMIFVDEHSEPICPRSFRRKGRVSSDKIARKSIVSVRNLYGIPLLIRTAAVRNNSYDSAFPCTADIDFAIAMGKGCDIYHIPEPLIALRIHQHNNTHSQINTIYRELKSCAVKNKILLSNTERILMKMNDYWQRSQKKLFFIFLNHFRSR